MNGFTADSPSVKRTQNNRIVDIFANFHFLFALFVFHVMSPRATFFSFDFCITVNAGRNANAVFSAGAFFVSRQNTAAQRPGGVRWYHRLLCRIVRHEEKLTVVKKLATGGDGIPSPPKKERRFDVTEEEKVHDEFGMFFYCFILCKEVKEKDRYRWKEGVYTFRLLPFPRRQNI